MNGVPRVLTDAAGEILGGDPVLIHEPSGQQRITIAPVVSGAGGNGLGQILLGAALIAVSWWNPMGWAAAGSFLSQATLYSVGTSINDRPVIKFIISVMHFLTILPIHGTTSAV